MIALAVIAAIIAILVLLVVLHLVQHERDARLGSALRTAAGTDNRAWLAVRETECAAELERTLAVKYENTVRRVDRTNVVRLVPRAKSGAA